MKFYIQDRETGTIIEIAESLSEAKRILEIYEEHDKRDECYTPDFYEIVDEERKLA